MIPRKSLRRKTVASHCCQEANCIRACFQLDRRYAISQEMLAVESLVNFDLALRQMSRCCSVGITWLHVWTKEASPLP